MKDGLGTNRGIRKDEETVFELTIVSEDLRYVKHLCMNQNRFI